MRLYGRSSSCGVSVVHHQLPGKFSAVAAAARGAGTISRKRYDVDLRHDSLTAYSARPLYDNLATAHCQRLASLHDLIRWRYLLRSSACARRGGTLIASSIWVRGHLFQLINLIRDVNCFHSRRVISSAGRQ